MGIPGVQILIKIGLDNYLRIGGGIMENKYQLLANKWKDQADETDDVEEQKWLYACVADLQTLINQK